MLAREIAGTAAKIQELASRVAEAQIDTSTPQGSTSLQQSCRKRPKQLPAVDRYERRALLRRKIAIQVLDEARLAKQVAVDRSNG